MTGSTAVGEGLLCGRHDLQTQHARVLEALDTDRMGPLLAAALHEEPDAPCVVVDAKYEPGRVATVLYRLGGGLVHATVPPAGPAPGGAAPGRVLVNGTVVARFPADPDLPTLGTVLDPGAFAAALRATGLPVGGVVGVRLLRYRPGRRATLLVEVGPEAAETYVAKAYHDRAKAAAVAREGRALHALGLPPPLVLAPVVAHLADLALVVQGHLPGRALDLDLADPQVDGRRRHDVMRAGEALASLHSGTVPVGRPRPVERELRRFVGRAEAVRSVDPEAGEALLELAHDLLAWFPGPGAVSLVHGDCKPSQFLVDADRVALLDLDHCGIAEPAYDVGNFVSSLRQAALRTAGPDGAHADGPTHAGHAGDAVGAVDAARAVGAARAAEALGPAFVTAYVDRARPGRADELLARVRYYVVVSLLRKALRAWARSPRSTLPGRLVDEARRAAADAGLGGRRDGRR